MIDNTLTDAVVFVRCLRRIVDEDKRKEVTLTHEQLLQIFEVIDFLMEYE